MPTSKGYHKEDLKGGGLYQFDSGTLYAHHGLHIHVHYVTLYLALVSSSAEECRTILGGGGRALLGLLPGALGEIQQAHNLVLYMLCTYQLP